MTDEHPSHRAGPLIPKILAAIEAKEVKARAATDGPWTACSDHALIGERGESVADRRNLDANASYDIGSPMLMADVVFMADNDPTDVLRRCAADREIVKECRGALEVGSWEETPYRAEAVLTQLAKAYGVEVAT